MSIQSRIFDLDKKKNSSTHRHFILTWVLCKHRTSNKNIIFIEWFNFFTSIKPIESVCYIYNGFYYLNNYLSWFIYRLLSSHYRINISCGFLNKLKNSICLWVPVKHFPFVWKKLQVYVRNNMLSIWHG